MKSKDTGEPTHIIARFLKRQGIEPKLALGFVALTIFMIGDGIESGFLSPYLNELGFSGDSVALLWSVYGFVVALAAWLAGALAEAWGPKRVMVVGLVIWIVLEVVFLAAIRGESFSLMLVAFGVRGLGYPLFAYGFLVWVTMGTPASTLGRGVGWYWFFSTLGLGVIGGYFAGAVIPLIGEFATLTSALGFVLVGGLLCIFGIKAPVTEKKVALGEAFSGMAKSITIVKDHPKVGIGGIIRLINTTSLYAFVAFLGTYMVREVGFSVSEWQFVWGTMMAANVIANIIAGYVGDWFGRARTVAWFGCALTGISCLTLFYVPTLFGPNLWLTLVIAVVYGIGLGMFVPLTAIVPLLAPKNKAAAVAVLNLGAGASQFVGPALGGLVSPIGTAGTVWVIVAIYGVGFCLSRVLPSQRTSTQLATETTSTSGLQRN